YKTANTKHFKELIYKVADHSFLIADECHYFGSKACRGQTFERFNARVGLSATPDRWWDEKGTQFIKNTFYKVVYYYTLDEAIKNDKLTHYKYFPHIVSHSELEVEDYERIITKLVSLNKEDEENDAGIQILNRRRPLTLAKAADKIPKLLTLLSNEK